MRRLRAASNLSDHAVARPLGSGFASEAQAYGGDPFPVPFPLPAAGEKECPLVAGSRQPQSRFAL